MDNTIITTGLSVLFLGFAIFFLWKTHRSKFGSSRAIVTTFAPPPGFTPMLAGLLQDEYFDDADLLGGLVNLAEQNIVSLMKVQNDYEIVLQREIADIKEKSDILLVELLFGDVPQKGAKEQLSMLKQVGVIVRGRATSSTLSTQGIDRMKKINTLYLYLSEKLVNLGLARQMTIGHGSIRIIKRTKAGDEIRGNILGFATYLKTVYKHKYKQYPIPTPESKHVNEFLSYAIALGVTKEFLTDVTAQSNFSIK